VLATSQEPKHNKIGYIDCIVRWKIAFPQATCCHDELGSKASNHARLCRRTSNPETPASSSRDSDVCILQRTTLKFEEDIRSLRGPGPRSIGHVLIL